MPDIKDLPRGDYNLVKTYTYKDFGHRTGQEVQDHDAVKGAAWEVRVSHKDPPNYMIYGPYAVLPKGNYVAVLHVKLMDATDDMAGSVDSCVNLGNVSLGLGYDIWPKDLVIGRYVWLPFPIQYPGGKLEIRLYWNGIADLRLDEVQVYSVENANHADFVHRVPQPVYSRNPNNLSIPIAYRPFEDVFPRSNPPSSHLLVLDLRSQPLDWQLAAFCIQGLVNRIQPRIYCLYKPTDTQWLLWMVKRKFIQDYTTITIPELLKKYHTLIKGMIITDIDLPATINVATMLAGVRDGIAVSPRISKELKLPVIADLRHRWTKSVDAYRWSFDNLWPKLNHFVTACIYPNNISFRDYLVENKVFSFWLSGPVDGAEPYSDPNAEVKLMANLFSKMPVNTPVMGYPYDAGKGVGIGEGAGVTLFAQFAHYLIGSVGSSNLSVHSGIRGIVFKQSAPHKLKLNRNKAYASFIISDGDNLPVLSFSNFPQIWQSDVRGKMPFGWTVSPAAYMLIPDIADYYYATAKPNDYFVSAVSGIGYTYPDSYAERYKHALRTRIFNGFLDQTRHYMKRMDLHVSWVMNVINRRIFAEYSSQIPFLQAIFPDYGRVIASYAEADYPVGIRNTPVFHAVNGWQYPATEERQINFIAKQVEQITPKTGPAFLHVFVRNWGANLPMLKGIVNRLGPRYQFVRPDQLAQLYKEYLKTIQVLTDFPTKAQYIVNHPAQIAFTLQNVSSHPLRIRIKSLEGLSDASTTLPSAIQPGKLVNALLTGKPDGGPIRLQLIGLDRETVIGMVMKGIRSDEILSSIPINLLTFLKDFKIFSLPHFSGKTALDENGNMVWKVTAGLDKPGMLCFGPYFPLAAGNYLALFRVKRLDEGEGVALIADTCMGGGFQGVEATKTIPASELKVGHYRYISLEFHHSGGPIETRLNWPGAFSLEADDVTLWKIIK